MARIGLNLNEAPSMANKLLLALLIMFLLGGMSDPSSMLVEDDTTMHRESDSNEVIPSHIEIWSASSLENPLILFEECVLADLVVDSQGNTYVTGTFKDEIRFGNNTLSNSDYAVFVSKLNRHGIWEWAYQSFGDEARSHGITLDESEQNLYVVGSFFFDNWFGQFGQNYVTSSTELQMFVAKMTLDGNFVYVKTPTSGNSSAEAVIASSGGGAYITGVHRSQLNLINVNSLPADEDDAFVISMDADGSWLWATSTSCGTGTTSRQSQYCGNENASSLTLGPDGDLHVLGVMDIDTIFGEDPGGPELSLAGGTDVFIWSIDPTDGSSTGVFGTTGEGNESSAEIASLGENLIISGNFFGQMFLDGINVSSLTLGSFMLSAGFVGSYSVMEDPPSWNWVRTVGGTTDSGPTSGRFTLVDLLSLPWTPPWELTDVVIGPDGSIHVAGEYRLDTQLDSLTLPSTDVIWVDAFVAQLSSDGDWQNVMSVGGMGPDGMTRIGVINSEVRVGFDSHQFNVTFADNTHYPFNRSVIVGAFEWDRDADGIADGDEVPGCTDPAANNYDPEATESDRSCQYDPDYGFPSITVLGEIVLTLQKSVTEEYTDAGATCHDEEDGDLSSVIEVSGEMVNMRIPGTYVINYDCTDSDGNSAPTANRTVIISPATFLCRGIPRPVILNSINTTIYVCDEGEWSELVEEGPLRTTVGCDEKPNEEELDASNFADLLNEHGEILVVNGNDTFYMAAGETHLWKLTNRAEMMKIIMEGFSIINLIEEKEPDAEFDDVEEGEWYDGFILEIVISSGEEIDFSPGEVASRAQIMTWKFTKYNSSNDGCWTDSDGLATWKDDCGEGDVSGVLSVANQSEELYGSYHFLIELSVGYPGQEVWDEIEVYDSLTANIGASVEGGFEWIIDLEVDENGTVTNATIIEYEACPASDSGEGDSDKTPLELLREQEERDGQDYDDDGYIGEPPSGMSGDVDITGGGDVADLIVVGGAAILAGIGISSMLSNRPGFRRRILHRRGEAKDAYDGAKFIADKAKGKKATVGGSDHYLKPGVERQEAMSTAADTALDDYVED